MSKVIVLSGRYGAPILLSAGNRTAAVQAVEAFVVSDGVNPGNVKGNEAIRNFIEAKKHTLNWAGYRLDVVELPEESK